MRKYNLKDKFKCSWLDPYCVNTCILPAIDKVEANPDFLCSHPPKEHLFLPFSIIDEFPRLIIMGQDPYTDSRATGLAFEVKKPGMDKSRSSLRTLSYSLGVKDGWFDVRKWAKDNAILLVNASPSCSTQKASRSKQYIAWRPFWNAVLRPLLGSRPIVVLTFGKKASALFENFRPQLGDRLLVRAHPASRKSKCQKMQKSDWLDISNKAKIKLPVESLA